MKKKVVIISIIMALVAVAIFIIRKNMGEKDYYIVSAGMGPMLVNQMVKEGYEVIGWSKLKNPHPRPITFEDAKFIQEKLPEWLKEHYPQCVLGEDFRRMPWYELVKKLKYKFTLLYDGKMAEGDIYLLQLSDGKEKVNVYIGKALVGDENDIMKSKTALVYPFFDEEWHSNIDFDKPYEPGDLW
jgi:hypothetical protein